MLQLRTYTSGCNPPFQTGILSHAQTVHGEWSEISEEYCGVTNAPAYLLISKLEKLGLTPTDIHNLEYLEDRSVLENLPGGFRWLKRNLREDVILYFESFASLLEDRFLNAIPIPEFQLGEKRRPKFLLRH